MQDRAAHAAGTRAPSLLVLGAGLAGLSAAYHARGYAVTVLEKAPHVGGLASTFRSQGHSFDRTGHWLHLQQDWVLDLLATLAPDLEWMQIQRRAEIYMRGRHIPYPFQLNLHALAPGDADHCLATLPQHIPQPSQAHNFAQYLRERFGSGMETLFFRPYNEKLWGSPLEELVPSCMSRFLPTPDRAAILAGARSPKIGEQAGYNASYRYPKSGGIDHLPRVLARALGAKPQHQVLCEHEVCAIDLRQKKVWVKGQGQPFGFDAIISTLALPLLMDLVVDLPPKMADLRAQLSWVSWRYLDLALSRPPPRRCHWLYVPEPNFDFFRVGCPSHACPAMAPKGQASLHVELGDRDAPLALPKILEQLHAVGMIASPQDLKFANERRIEHAYVKFDHNYPKVLPQIVDWLSSQGLSSCGRYGAWGYGSMEDSMESGRLAACALPDHALDHVHAAST